MKTIVYIIGLGHSGSTLLGNLLGSAQGAIHIGEIPSPISRKKVIQCKICNPGDCPIWDKLINKRYIFKLHKKYSRYIRLAKMSGFHKLSRLFTIQKNYVYEKIFLSIPDKQLIIDSSKSTYWASFNKKTRYVKKYIFLNRDIRAVLASYNRIYSDLYTGRMTIINRILNNIKRFHTSIKPNDKYILNYEELILSPENHLKKLCDFLDLKYSPEILEYYKNKFHLIGGNSGLIQQFLRYHQLDDTEFSKKYTDQLNYRYYEQNKIGLNLDERWKEELNPIDLEYIDKNIDFDLILNDSYTD